MPFKASREMGVYIYTGLGRCEHHRVKRSASHLATFSYQFQKKSSNYFYFCLSGKLHAEFEL